MDNNIIKAINDDEFDNTEKDIICMYWSLFEIGFIDKERREELIKENIHDYNQRLEECDEDYMDVLEDMMSRNNESILS